METNRAEKTETAEVGDRVTDGNFTGNVVRACKDRVLVKHWGRELQEGKLVTHWFYRSSLTVVRKVSEYRAA